MTRNHVTSYGVRGFKSLSLRAPAPKRYGGQVKLRS